MWLRAQEWRRGLWGCLVAVLALSPALAETQSCPPGNLLAGAQVSGRGLLNNPPAVTDGTLLPEATPWNAPGAVVFGGESSFLGLDLGRALNIHALQIQARHDAGYVIEGSLGGWHWQEVWTAPVMPGVGLRTRETRLAGVQTVRYLRVRGSGGDGIFSVSELRAWCREPDPWPPSGVARQIRPDAPGLTREVARGIKAALAVAALGLFLWGLVLARVGRSDSDRRLRGGILLALGLLAGAAWWNFGRFNFERYLHLWDQYHYFIGAKYSAELGYDRLYECTAVADVEDGFEPQVRQRKIRDLETNLLVTTDAIVADPERCTRHFSGARWRDFKRDIAWFRGNMSEYRWMRTQRDHGYNATPVWEIVAVPLANTVAASDGTMLALGLIDAVLLLVMWGLVFRVFGWKPAAVALLWWGTNQIAEFEWTGGGFLRQDWLVLAVVGLCGIKRGKMFAGGFALTYATLLRIYPAFMVAALVIKVVAGMWRKRRFVPEPAHRRFALGCVAALVLLGALSLAVPGDWTEFANNSRAYLGTPGTNLVGLKVVAAYEPQTRMELTRDTSLADPDEKWKEARTRTFGERRISFLLILAAFLVLFVRAIGDEPDWVALALGVALIPMVSAPACYYLSILLVLGLLWERRGPSVGVLLCVLSLVTQLAHTIWSSRIEYDQRYAAISFFVVLGLVTLLAIWRPRRIS